MKSIILYILTIVLVCSCHFNKSKKELPPIEDSLEYYPPTPKQLSKKEFRHYYNYASHFFDTLLDERGFNGSYLVAKDGEVIVEKYVGYEDPTQKKEALHPESSFHLASVSKTFTAMAILKLWEQGKLDINDNLSYFFQDFPYPEVTVKMLLNHRSGLPNYVHYLEQSGWDKKKMVTNYDVLASLYTLHPPLQYPVGKHFSYCNTNYVLLALIIEKITNRSFPAYMQEAFFKPLGMKNSYVYALKDSTRSIPSFEWNNRKYNTEFLDLTYGDKNIYSTVRDMLKWDQALYSETLFSKATLDSAFAPYSFERDGKRNYGLGWRMTLLDNGKKFLYHNGWWHGNNTVFIRLLDEKATIIVLGNKFNKRIYKAKNLADMFGKYQQGNQSDDAEVNLNKKNSSTGGPR